MALQLRNPQFKKLTETPQRKTYTVAVSTIILVVLMVFFAIRPAVSSIFNRTSENKAKNEVLSKMDAKYQNLLSLSNQQTEKATSLTLLDESMPESRQEEFLTSNLNGVAQDTNVKITGININRNVSKSVVKANALGINSRVASFNMGVRGNRSDVINFVSKLEGFPKILNIFSFTLLPTGGTEYGSNSYDGNIQAEFYYYSLSTSQ
jgi:Tfp pilus assembly protein PilO